MATTAPTETASPETPTSLFNVVEHYFPSRLREHGWYLTMVTSLIATGQQKDVGQLYKHLIAQSRYQSSGSRQPLVRRLREAMVKCIILTGIPVVMEAAMSLQAEEAPEDRDYSITREDWQVTPESSALAAQHLQTLYNSPDGGAEQAWSAHRDIPWISTHISYGLFLSDHRILTMQETELIILPAVMCQNLRGPTYWHLRACLRVGMTRDEVEALHRVIELVAARAGKVLDVQRVADVQDAEAPRSPGKSSQQ